MRLSADEWRCREGALCPCHHQQWSGVPEPFNTPQHLRPALSVRVTTSSGVGSLNPSTPVLVTRHHTAGTGRGFVMVHTGCPNTVTDITQQEQDGAL
ncbi:hypothetical protein ACOMHN_051592 [Nucella lapillus]